jgi:catalase
VVKIVAPQNGKIKSADGAEIKVDKTFITTASVLFDAVFVPGGAASIATLGGEADAYQFVDEAYKHCKAIAATGEGVGFVGDTFAGKAQNDKAVVLGATANDVTQNFIKAIAEHRNWERETVRKVPA